MQTLKEEIRNEIVSAAKEEFRARGFPGASMQRIAGKAGLSVSNIYNYFPSKEALFDRIVEEVRGSLASMADDTPVLWREARKRGESARVFREYVPSAFFSLIKSKRAELIIALECGAGTKHAELKDRLAASLSGRIMENVKGSGSRAFLVRVIAMNLIQGLVEIAKEYRSDSWAEENVRLLVHYHIRGMMEFSS